MIQYESPFPETAKATVLNPHGVDAICCFWMRRGPNESHESADPRVQAVIDDTGVDAAVVGNSFYSRRTMKMDLSALKIAKALSWNPQIKRLLLVGAEDERSAMSGSLVKLVGNAPFREEWTRNQVTALMVLPGPEYPERVAIAMPKPQPPAKWPRRYDVGMALHGTDLSVLHAELLATTLRYGHEPSEDDDKPRHDLASISVCWHTPFELGAFHDFPETLADYVEGTQEGGTDYTYRSRFDEAYNQRWKGRGSRKNYYPVWIPGDADHAEPPCLTSLYIRHGVVVASFRAHNFLEAWPDNTYLVKCLAELRSDEPLKTIVMQSLQGGIRPDQADEARKVIRNRSPEGVHDISDRAGAWTAEPRDDQIAAVLLVDGDPAAEYVGDNPEAVRDLIVKDRALPEDSGESAWLGGELANVWWREQWKKSHPDSPTPA